MQVGIRRFAHRQFDGRDTQTPDVRLKVVAALLDHLGAHPVRGSDKGVFLGHGGGELARDTEIGKLDVAGGGKEDVGCFDVAMELAFAVKVFEALSSSRTTMAM